MSSFWNRSSLSGYRELEICIYLSIWQRLYSKGNSGSANPQGAPAVLSITSELVSFSFVLLEETENRCCHQGYWVNSKLLANILKKLMCGP